MSTVPKTSMELGLLWVQ